MKIRKANKRDCKIIEKLYQELHDHHVEGRPDIFKNVKALTKERYENLLKDGIILVYDDNGIKGFCYFLIKPSHDIGCMVDGKYLYIDAIVVSKELRGNKIGKKLYEETINYARDNKCERIELNVWNFNKSAIKFYGSLGMKIKSMKLEYKL